MLHHLALLAAASPVPNVAPGSGTPLPGSHELTSLLGGFLTVALVLCVFGIILSAVLMAIGHHSANSRAADRGRTGLIASLIGAVVCGAGVALINFAFSVGQGVH
jgi:hypothetical protein